MADRGSAKNSWSHRSASNLGSCDERLQEIMNAVLKIIDCTVIEGHRGQEAQNEYFRTRKSRVQFPNSKHNLFPSKAVDVAPCPIDYNDTKRFYYFAGVVKGVAASLGYEIRWGGDWDSDNDLNDQTFMDLVHFEIVGD